MSSPEIPERKSWSSRLAGLVSSKFQEYNQRKLDNAIRSGIDQLATIASETYTVVQRAALAKCLSPHEADEISSHVELHRRILQESLQTAPDLSQLEPAVSSAVTKFKSVCLPQKDFAIEAEMAARPEVRLKNLLLSFEELFQKAHDNGTCDAEMAATLFDQLTQYSAAFQRSRSSRSYHDELNHRHAHHLINSFYGNLMSTYLRSLNTQSIPQ